MAGCSCLIQDRPHDQSLHGRIALITGTAGGQGAVAAELFAQAEATVVGCDVKEAPVSPGSTSPTRRPSAGGSNAVEEHGQIDILYANAGATRFNPIEDVTADEWDFVLRHELDVVFFPVKHAGRT